MRDAAAERTEPRVSCIPFRERDRARTGARPASSAARVAALVPCAIVWLGFVCHTSPDAALLGKYSLPYAAFLLLVTIGGAAACRWIWRCGTIVPTRAFAARVGAALVGVLIVLPWAYVFAHRRSLNATVFQPLDRRAHAFFQVDEAPPLPAVSDPAVRRVLCLGGSTTYGEKLQRTEAYPAVLEQLLDRSTPGVRWQVHNAGVGWHTSMHSLLRYVSAFARWRPDVVIVMHAFNDVYQTSEGRFTSGAFRDDYGHFFGALGLRVNPRDGFDQTVHELLLQNPLARTWYSDLRAADAAPRPVDLLRALPSFRRNMSELVRRARDDGALVVLVAEPFSYRDGMSAEELSHLFYRNYYDDYAEVPTLAAQTDAMRAFDAAVADVARQQGAVFVDAEAALPKSGKFFIDDVHFTAAGARVVAETIFRATPWPRTP